MVWNKTETNQRAMIKVSMFAAETSYHCYGMEHSPDEPKLD